MKRGEIRYCACGCGEPAKRIYSGNRFKSWRAYASGHAPNERLDIHAPKMISDLAYAAGIIDGEGCIYARVQVTKAGTVSTFLQVQIIMCSENVVAWFAQMFGGDVYVDQPRSLNNRVRFRWQVRGRQVATILRAILPYLREKKQRAVLAIELADLIEQGKGREVPAVEMTRRQDIAASIKAFNQNVRSEDVLH